MTRLLVTGANGFVGQWTLRHWRTAHPDVEIWATSDRPGCPKGLADQFAILDLRDAEAVREFVRSCRPDGVVHLAGLVGKASLADHMAVNVLGTENLYQAVLELDHAAEVRIVQAGTAAMYGQVSPDDLPIKESCTMRPLTPYAISKMTQDCLAEMLWRTHGLQVIRARVFNLLGPGQPEHLVPATFIKQLRAAHNGGTIRVGNLASRRDFVDVRDVAEAFDRLLERGEAGQAYNVASGESTSIRRVLDELVAIADLRALSIEEEQPRVRRNDVPDVAADIGAIARASGWRPQVPMKESLKAMYGAA